MASATPINPHKLPSPLRPGLTVSCMIKVPIPMHRLVPKASRILAFLRPNPCQGSVTFGTCLELNYNPLRLEFLGHCPATDRPRGAEQVCFSIRPDFHIQPLDPIRRRQGALDLVGLAYIYPITNRHLDSITLHSYTRAVCPKFQCLQEYRLFYKWPASPLKAFVRNLGGCFVTLAKKTCHNSQLLPPSPNPPHISTTFHGIGPAPLAY
ncbi:hypothetical protein B9Z19DRAFT_700747 [Tuber borchii]|uniref:Uncharacterized protein n=1 Tax=Tuber borchii TaxID=42251 RepID=A0A2T6ZYX1_TUBBO|nr:hypothetical protein B9Z19DRAFT_700747 [Tuber borchii]